MGLVAAAFAAWLAAGIYLPVGGGRQPVRITVQPDASPREVAAELRAAGLIRSATAFQIAAAWGDGWRQARAGDYALRRDMSAVAMLRAIERGEVVSESVTFPEGRTVWQMAEAAAAAGLGSADDFMRAAGAGGAREAGPAPADFGASFPLPGDSLEGYLFPDTYSVAHRPGAARDLVQKMLARFDEVVWRELLDGREPTNGQSLHQLITLASLVEAEAKLADERPIIAAVLLNRLKRGMPLECDATVQYALGPDRKPRLFNNDLKIASPYNTYLHPGLPPGPINSPGRASITAALHPASVPYLFYVARPDGSHVFTSTYAEHLRAVARSRAARASQQAPGYQAAPSPAASGTSALSAANGSRQGGAR